MENQEEHQQEETKTFVVDGLIVDEDGSYYGHADPLTSIQTQDDAEVVMSTLMNIDTRIAALEAQEQKIVANVRVMKKRLERTRRGVVSTWEAPLLAFARHAMGKKRSWTCPFGQIKFTVRRGSIKVVDEALFASKHPECVVQVQKVQVSQLSGDARGSYMSNPDKAFEVGLSVDVPGENSKIDTSVTLE